MDSVTRAKAPLRIGILGAAKIAPSAVIKPGEKIDGVTICALAARDQRRAQAFAKKHGIERTVGSYQELIEDENIDAVYNPLPNGLHGKWTLRAIDASKHVLCEKPFAANEAEAQSVADAASKSDRVVMEAFHYRFHPLTHRIEDIISSGELGSIEEITIAFSSPGKLPGDIRYKLDLAGGALMDMGCYTIHILRLLAGGEPTVVSAKAKKSSHDVDRAMRATFILPSGGTARIRTSMFSSTFLAIHANVKGSTGSMGVRNPFAPQIRHRLLVKTKDGTRLEKLTRKPSYEFQLEAFRDSVQHGAPVVTTPDDAVINMRVIDHIYQAAGLSIRQPTP